MNKTIAICLVFLTMMTSCAQNSKNDYVVTIKTDHGDMIAILYDETPKHKENFIKLSKEKFYDSLLFHRIIKGFMIQGGDPDSKHAKPGARLGSGGPGYTVDAEFNPKYFHEKGALSAARMGDNVNPKKASSGSQFYIVHGTIIPENQMKVNQAALGMGLQQLLQKPENKSLYDSLFALYQTGDMKAYEARVMELKPRIEKETGTSLDQEVSPEKVKAYSTIGGAPHLDGEYTVFGKVIKGLDVIDKIAEEQKDGADRPLKDIRFSISVEEMSKKKIEKLYGYTYPEVKKK